ncbi:hypothetical protein MKW98_028757 [Papaver atlanticum]|uniref:Uncharacterized protein n=1 Tax=Papaver atlanticum TaxID=357466 RepID=A0AAD4SCE5_9MAGN|nr:hypothetical protein MKW98_028757 [Papaver atlanticum]
MHSVRIDNQVLRSTIWVGIRSNWMVYRRKKKKKSWVSLVVVMNNTINTYVWLTREGLIEELKSFPMLLSTYLEREETNTTRMLVW